MLLLAVPLFAIGAASNADAKVAWRQLEPGLELAVPAAPRKSQVGDSRITLLRIDPKYFRFRLIAVKKIGGSNRTAGAWARKYGLVAAINAGMFLRDHKTSVGFMRHGKTVLQPRMVPGYNAMLAFDPSSAVKSASKSSAGLPPVQILDLRCGQAAARAHYRVLVQSLRMVDCRGRNRWGRDAKRWSVAAMAMDAAGRILFIHSRSPYTMHVFVNMLRRLLPGLRTTLYLEGGPEATLYLNAGTRFERVGSYETGFNENDNNTRAWALPNVIGIVRR